MLNQEDMSVLFLISHPKEFQKLMSTLRVKRRNSILIFYTTLGQSIESLGNSRYLSTIDYFPMSADQLSLELAFKTHVSVDMFYLEGNNGNGRLVLDVKE